MSGAHTHHEHAAAHPTAVALARSLRAARPLAPTEWRSLLVDVVRAIARVVDGRGATLIGHIKAVVVVPDGYIRVSAVDVAHAPTAEIRATAVCTMADFTVNVLVYGLSQPVVAEIAADALARSADAANVVTAPRDGATPSAR